MSNPEWDDLIVKLKNETDAKARREGYKLLADARDPATIPALRDAYKNDEDDKVKAIAHDALARFKAIKEGKSGGGSRVLNLLLILLVLTFIGSLALNGMALLADEDTEATPIVRELVVTDRGTLIAAMSAKLSEHETLTFDLRGEIKNYNDTGSVDCTSVESHTLPEPYTLSEDDRFVYPDLPILEAKLNTPLPNYEAVINLLSIACRAPEVQTKNVISASEKLNDIDIQLFDIRQTMQQSIDSPAPTNWYTPTPPPPTDVPTATSPPTAVGIAPDSTNTDAGTDSMATLTAVAVAPTQPPAATAPPTATFTPQPTATLPLPELDYPALLADLNSRLPEYFLLDLHNPYGTGMLDQWQQAISRRGQTTNNYCNLSQWPTAFTLTPEQQTLLDDPATDDVLLAEAVTLQQRGFELVTQARGLYERDCGNLELADSAERGIELLEQALENFGNTQMLLDEIAAR
jgi:hypothetical protein